MQPMAPQPPTGLNFQSDPNMRSQFKGFMSGMQARQPSPMMPMEPQPMMPVMPSQMSNIDIFQPMPVQSFQVGGIVGTGQGEVDPGLAAAAGIDTRGMGPTADISRASGFGDDSGGEDGPISQFVDTVMNRNNFVPKVSIANQIGGFLGNLVGRGDNVQEETGPTATGGIQDALADQLAQNRTRQNVIDQQRAAENRALAEAFAPQIQAVQSQQDRNAMDLLNTIVAPSEREALGPEDFVGGDISMPSGYQPFTRLQTPQNTMQPQMPMPIPIPEQIANRRADLGSQRRDMPFVKSRTTEVDVPLDASLLNEKARRDAMQSMGAELLPVQQDSSVLGDSNLVTRGFGAGMTPMEQLEARSQRDLFETPATGPIGSAVQGALNAVARGATGNVLEKLQEPGSTPVFDETGQIVGVTHSGLFGGTVYTGRPDYNPTGRGIGLDTEGRDAIRFSGPNIPPSIGNPTGENREAGALDRTGDAVSNFIKKFRGGQ